MNVREVFGLNAGTLSKRFETLESSAAPLDTGRATQKINILEHLT
jgi:hypothetical protein